MYTWVIIATQVILHETELLALATSSNEYFTKLYLDTYHNDNAFSRIKLQGEQWFYVKKKISPSLLFMSMQRVIETLWYVICLITACLSTCHIFGNAQNSKDSWDHGCVFMKPPFQYYFMNFYKEKPSLVSGLWKFWRESQQDKIQQNSESCSKPLSGFIYRELSAGVISIKWPFHKYRVFTRCFGKF